MSLITLQQNHLSVHRVTAMTVKGKCLPKDEKKLLTLPATLLVIY